jgi:hypothetical protein
LNWLRRIGRVVALLVDALAAGDAVAQSSLDDRAFWAKAFETGRVYAADMTLVAYCLRKDPQTAAVVYLNVIDDMHGVIQLARTGAVDAREVSSFVREVMDATHFAAPTDNDPQTEKACVERNVEKAYFGLQPIGWPLGMRAPFKKN